MKKLSRHELIDGLRRLGLAAGDIVHVQSDLRRIGPVDAPLSKAAYCEFYLSAFLEVLGPGGTLSVCTSFEDYARFATPFVRESSPSLTDTFSEYVRTRPNAVRSRHPIMSACAIGAKASMLCGGYHRDGFGYDSPWSRLHMADAKILTLGMDETQGGTTFFHYVERLCGVPYQYTKLYDVPAYEDGRPIAPFFTLSVRYLDFGIENTPVKVKTRLLADDVARLARIGRTNSWIANAKPIVERMSAYFSDDLWIMLKTPPNFRPGEIPFDGATGAMRMSIDKGADGG